MKRTHPLYIIHTLVEFYTKQVGATCLGQSHSYLFRYISVLLLYDDLFTVDDIQAGLGWLVIESAAIQHVPVCG